MSEDAANSGSPKPRPTTRLTYHYLKTNSFRDVYVDGVFGGLSPSTMIVACPYTERPAIPRSVTHRVEVDESGKRAELKEVIDQEGRDGVIRDVDVALVLSPPEAVRFALWLLEKAHDSGFAAFEAAREMLDKKGAEQGPLVDSDLNGGTS